MNEIEIFIDRFNFLKSETVKNLFLNGDCYYFAIILKERFKEAIIKYLMIDNHFITEINGRLYDIRGDVTDIVDVSQMISWEEMEQFDELLYKRIIRDCINFDKYT